MSGCPLAAHAWTPQHINVSCPLAAHAWDPFRAGAYAFAAGKRWIQKPAIVYGISTATTLLPILGELLLSPAKDFNRPVLVAFYLPYLVLPLVLAARMLHMEEPFPQRARKLVSRKRM